MLYLGSLLLAVVPLAAAGAEVDPARARDPVPGWELVPLRWGSVRPAGWILDWADAARRGAVSPERSWFAAGTGANGRSNGWQGGRPPWSQDEQSAYWIDGMMRLGLVLGDQDLLNRARADVAAVIHDRSFAELQESGLRGWPRSVYSRAMLAHFDATGDPAVLPFFESVWNESYHIEVHEDTRSVAQCEALLEGYSFGASARLRDICLQGLAGNEARYMRAWVDAPCTDFDVHSTCFNRSLEDEHGVSWNEVAKLWAMASGWIADNASRAERYRTASLNAYKQLLARDMLPNGVNSAEEALSGIAPNASSETCDVADLIHSATWLLRVTGDAEWGDIMERAFHNAAPAAVSRTWTEHVYFQAPNLQKIPHDAYRLPGERYEMAQSHDPACCTGNQARLLPNYIHHMWMGFLTADGCLGLAAAMYGPNAVTAAVGRPYEQRTVTIDVTTNYPFDTEIRMHLRVHEGGAATFPLKLRIPAWSKQPVIRVGDHVVVAERDKLGFTTVQRAWSDGDELTLNLPMTLEVETALTINNGGIDQSDNTSDGNRNNYVVGGLPYATVALGPLLFALPLEDGRDWQYALDLSSPMQVHRAPMPRAPWDWPLNAPLSVTVTARTIRWPDVWTLPNASHALGEPGVQSSALTLVPYGCTKVFRVSMFPFVVSGRARSVYT